jgi:hypothetical protein
MQRGEDGADFGEVAAQLPGGRIADGSDQRQDGKHGKCDTDDVQ